MSDFSNTLLQVTHNGMGHGDDELGLILIANYLKLINEESIPPKFIAFYNRGVELVCEGSPVVEIAKTLEQRGVKLIVCTTCLKFFNLFNKLEVGIPGTMMDIISLQKITERVINV